MAYLCKEARRTTLLEAAARIARREGLAATTVRRVAQEAGVATGQVHHHFSSAAELRAQAYTQVMKVLKDQLLEKSITLTAREQLNLLLVGPHGDALLNAIPLWHEAMLLTEQEPRMKAAFAVSVADWHELVSNAITLGRQKGQFVEGESPEHISWRLIGLSSSMDAMSRLETLGLTADCAEYNLNRAIENELYAREPDRKETSDV
ncbi:TetR family transcriptional regulator [Rahnella sp. C60]|uniref:TetR family transcriptional regulator n=1 Tax=Rahnella perminowiae TaxID=2816244 RepID=A0ABS6L4K2_9GAMM|nr:MULTISPECIES: TetR family transcriptional regulator [Rahnella]UJD91937.1 TetR family transcriptional regulator [Rahnella aquatilis]MBU9813445.1 TetR family transcriptional regulator [Rahnella perminowiae]MBU9823742.1 TetR family transcriptional regulator [Rahnella perminowiae]MBU9836658.1 TetR family transcriptional regulator [Rahnella perminowiae]MCR9003687.1 TetR family transcriptional regulator [Rahnella perminowiae]